MEQTFFERSGLEDPAGKAPSPAQTTPDKARKLYLARHVAIATFLGSPIAGGHLLFLNYRRLGEPGKGVKTLALSIVGTAALMGVGWVLPDRIGSGVAIGGIVSMRYIAQHLQGERVEAHRAAGGAIASGWKAAGVGAAWMVAILAVIIGVVFLTDPGPGKAVDIGHGATVYLQPGATEADAKTMGEELVKGGFLRDDSPPIDLLLGRGPDGPEFGFIVGQDDPVTRASFETLARSLAPHLGGPPAVLRLLDQNLDEKYRKKIQ